VAACPAAAVDLRIPLVESVTTTTSLRPGIPGGVGVRFSVGGRDFDLQLEPNNSLQPGGAMRNGAQAYRGTVAGAPGSWVRVTRHRNRYSGAIFDGAQYFALETAAAAAPASDLAARLPQDTQVFYRLADIQVTGALFDGDTAAMRSGELAAESLLHEIEPATGEQIATRQLLVGALTDPEFNRLHGSDAEVRTLARVNVADGVFATQAGIQLRMSYTAFAETSPFSTSSSLKLLGQVSDYRRSSTVEAMTGLTHLFTGRNLDGDTIGIAYVASVCDARYAASLSEGRNGETFDGLVLAHEIGHVFGAPHDGDDAKACAATSPIYLMAARFNGSNTLSACSIEQMLPRLTASCLAPAEVADATFSVPAPGVLTVGHPRDVEFDVRSVGNISVRHVSVTVDLPTSITASSAVVDGGSCDVQVRPVRCLLGDIAPEATRKVRLRLVAFAGGALTGKLALAAANDGLPTNNTATMALDAVDGADLSTTVTVAPNSVLRGDMVSFTAEVHNSGTAAAPDVRLTVLLPAGFTPGSITPLTTGCTVGETVECQPFRLEPGSRASFSFSVRTSATGVFRIGANGSSSLVDPLPDNNASTASLEVMPLPVVPIVAATPSSSSGGGGTMDVLALSALLCALVALRGRRACVAGQPSFSRCSRSSRRSTSMVTPQASPSPSASRSGTCR
jgi:uncharacterized repeat protein (TIGR01451 family)